jgi:hypothetical protein
MRIHTSTMTQMTTMNETHFYGKNASLREYWATQNLHS